MVLLLGCEVGCECHMQNDSYANPSPSMRLSVVGAFRYTGTGERRRSRARSRYRRRPSTVVTAASATT